MIETKVTVRTEYSTTVLGQGFKVVVDKNDDKVTRVDASNVDGKYVNASIDSSHLSVSGESEMGSDMTSSIADLIISLFKGEDE